MNLVGRRHRRPIVAIVLLAVAALLSGCIRSFTPTSGSTLGGTTVIITGSGFTGATAVRFGATEATRFTVTSGSQITAVTKAHVAGTVRISVVTPRGYATSVSNFTFVPPSGGPVVSGSYSCVTRLGTKMMPSTIQDLNVVPSILPEGSTYTAKPQLVATIPASLIRSISQVTTGLTSVPVDRATLNITKVGFSGPTKIAASNLPVTVPINATTEAQGYAATFTYGSVAFHVTATAGTITLTPSSVTLKVRTTLTCVPPSITITYTPATTFTHPVFSGSNTLGPIDSTTAQPATVSGPDLQASGHRK